MERPILFSAPMVRAILAGTKTQTRRLMKGTALKWLTPDDGGSAFTPEYIADPGNASLCPYGTAGDRLWVRETWAAFTTPDYWTGECDEVTGPPSEMRTGIMHVDAADVVYAADDVAHPDRWRPAIHMPRWASRIDLEVTGLRVQALQDIREEDARAEGVDDGPGRGPRLYPSGQAARSSLGHRAVFAELWDEINGARATWASNPFVWAITFQRVERAKAVA